MSFKIAVGGKGGVGKTTVSALLVSRLVARRRHPVLAVDADPNSCLDQALGVIVRTTVGGIREEARQLAGQGMTVGVAKRQLLELKIAESVVESEGFDLIAMGRPEGPGCYCYANNVLRDTIQAVADHYPWVVIDNEAGLENLSRRIICRTDLLLLVSDSSQSGLETLRRLHALASDMGTTFRFLGIVINRLRGPEFSTQVEELRRELGANVTVGLPEDETLWTLSESGRSLFEVPADNAVVSRIDGLLAWIEKESAVIRVEEGTHG